METSFNKENIIGHVYQNLEIFTCLKIPVSLDNKKTGPYRMYGIGMSCHAHGMRYRERIPTPCVTIFEE